MANNYQQAERQAAITRRIRDSRRKGDSCRCDWCGEREGVQTHEIFPRSLTIEGTEKRDACYSRYVISRLCAVCHSKIQHSPSDNRELLKFNRKLWGIDVVDAHILYMKNLGVNVEFQDRLGGL
jgi:hypothetical protein